MNRRTDEGSTGGIDGGGFLLGVRLREGTASAGAPTGGADDAGAYVFGLPVVRHLAAMGRLPLHPRVTLLVGENGTGKSTLLEAIAAAYGFNPEGGSLNLRFSTADTHAPLHEDLVLEKGVRRARTGYFLRAESFYNVASEIDALDRQPAAAPKIVASYGGVSLHRMSHGEAFLALVANRFGPRGLYLLDEPEAALSPAKQIALLVRIGELASAGSQFVVATHAPILMAAPDAWLYWIDADGIERRDFRSVEHVQLMRRFLERPGRYLSDEAEPD
jgi:predicted ATPase